MTIGRTSKFISCNSFFFFFSQRKTCVRLKSLRAKILKVNAYRWPGCATRTKIVRINRMRLHAVSVKHASHFSTWRQWTLSWFHFILRWDVSLGRIYLCQWKMHSAALALRSRRWLRRRQRRTELSDARMQSRTWFSMRWWCLHHRQMEVWWWARLSRW